MRDIFGKIQPKPRKITEQEISDGLDDMVAKNGGRPIGSPVLKGPYRLRNINTIDTIDTQSDQ